MRRRVLTAGLATALALGAATLLISCGDERRKSKTSLPPPALGRKWGPTQLGYGTVRPVKVFNGGDPTGLVDHIRWTNWGKPMAVGYGEAEFVWPGTAVADNGPTKGARVVAFHLRTCRGRRAYTAIEWYFPRFDESFDPHRYINACTGDYVGLEPHLVDCPDVSLADGTATATDVQVQKMPCGEASVIIARSRSSDYLEGGGRFVESGFRCGTQGAGALDALFSCRLGDRGFLYTIE
jgi:hypothetical protein